MINVISLNKRMVQKNEIMTFSKFLRNDSTLKIVQMVLIGWNFFPLIWFHCYSCIYKKGRMKNSNWPVNCWSKKLSKELIEHIVMFRSLHRAAHRNVTQTESLLSLYKFGKDSVIGPNQVLQNNLPMCYWSDSCFDNHLQLGNGPCECYSAITSSPTLLAHWWTTDQWASKVGG